MRFDYEEFKKVNLAAVKKDLYELMTILKNGGLRIMGIMSFFIRIIVLEHTELQMVVAVLVLVCYGCHLILFSKSIN